MTYEECLNVKYFTLFEAMTTMEAHFNCRPASQISIDELRGIVATSMEQVRNLTSEGLREAA